MFAPLKLRKSDATTPEDFSPRSQPKPARYHGRCPVDSAVAIDSADPGLQAEGTVRMLLSRIWFQSDDRATDLIPYHEFAYQVYQQAWSMGTDLAKLELIQAVFRSNLSEMEVATLQAALEA